MTLLLATLGCSHPATTAPSPGDTDASPAIVRDWLDGAPSTSGGTLVVQTESDPGVEVDLPEPTSTGLAFTAEGKPRVEHVAGRTIVTERYDFTGPSGHYVIPALSAPWKSADKSGTAATTAVFVDLGLPPPREGELADIDEPSRVWGFTWVYAGVAVLATGALGAGALLAFRRGKAPVVAPLPPEPPDVIALRAWDRVRRDPSLTDHDKALQLSLIFREYAEVALRFPAASWTTTETLEHLRGLVHLPEGNVPRAKRLLRATDRVKYAEARVGVDLFEELDADLRAFVQSTRPQRWQEGQK